ncbi:MAG: hypothetical protein OER43_13070 [Gammaproteobacteria bacterium]|nr:hypothetical protein [Gammaproteobacteria bacterium]MDH3412599.1 hypothetical protein [Gammaproteobacteria bacterium]
MRNVRKKDFVYQQRTIVKNKKASPQPRAGGLFAHKFREGPPHGRIVVERDDIHFVSNQSRYREQHLAQGLRAKMRYAAVAASEDRKRKHTAGEYPRDPAAVEQDLTNQGYTPGGNLQHPGLISKRLRLSLI